MATKFDPKLPTELTVANWTKAKGTVAQLYKTGITEALTALQKDWPKPTEWLNLSIDSPVAKPVSSLQPGTNYLKIPHQNAEAQFDKLSKTVLPELIKLNKLAAAAADKFKASKTVPAAVGKSAAAMAKKAIEIHGDINPKIMAARREWNELEKELKALAT